MIDNIIDVVDVRGAFYIRKQVEIRNGLTFMRMKKRKLVK